MVEVARNGDRLALELTPKRMQRDNGEAFWGLGVAPPANIPEPKRDAVLRYGPLQAVPAALRESVHQTRELFAMIGRAFTGRVSIQNTVAGPVTIGRAANAYANNGAASYLQLLAMLSLSSRLPYVRPKVAAHSPRLRPWARRFVGYSKNASIGTRRMAPCLASASFHAPLSAWLSVRHRSQSGVCSS